MELELVVSCRGDLAGAARAAGDDTVITGVDSTSDTNSSAILASSGRDISFLDASTGRMVSGTICRNLCLTKSSATPTFLAVVCSSVIRMEGRPVNVFFEMISSKSSGLVRS